MATPEENLQKFQEIANRGIQDQLSPEIRLRFNEAVNRGLVTLPNIRVSEGDPGLQQTAIDTLQQPAQTQAPIVDPGTAQTEPGFIERQGFDRPPTLQDVKGGVEGFLAIGSSLLAEPIAGLFGIATGVNPFAEEGDAARNIEFVRNAITFQPTTEEGIGAIQNIAEPLKPLAEKLEKVRDFMGEDAFQATGSPALGAIAFALPDAFLETIGGGAGRRILTRAEKSTREAERVADVTGARADTLEPVAETISRGTPEEVADLVNADPEFFRAADELGVSTEPLASFASQNPQFRAVEQGLASIPTSILDTQTKAFITDLGQRADNIIEQFGGTLDKGQLNIDFKRQSLDAIDDLATQADNIYGQLATQIPKSSRFSAPATVDFLTNLSNDLGGVDELPGRLRTMLRSLEGTPTLGKIDQVRREIGQAINKRSGPFKDVETGLNKALYARLTRDQDAIAQSSGLGGVTDSAKDLIIRRKQIEDNTASLLGKDLNQALSVNVAGAVKNLSKGQIDRFNNVVNSIDESIRGEVVLSAMNDVFKGTGVGQQSLNPTQFVKWFETLNRSPATKATLFRNLPQGSQQAVENLFKVSKGVSRALGDRVPTGRLNAMFNPDTGFIRNLVGRAAPSVVAFSTGSPTASLATNAVVDFMRQGNNATKRASDLLASPQMQNIIRRSVKEGVVEGLKDTPSTGLQKAIGSVTNTKPYKEWVTTLSQDQSSRLARVGLVNYLFSEERLEEEQE